MKRQFFESIIDRINESKKEGFSGVEIDIYMRIYDVNIDLLNDLAALGYDVIYVEQTEDIFPKLLISWD